MPAPRPAAKNLVVVYLAAMVSAFAAATVGVRVGLAVMDRLRPTPFEGLRAEVYAMWAAWIVLPALIVALAPTFSALRERRDVAAEAARGVGLGLSLALFQWGVSKVFDPMAALGQGGVLAEVFLLPAFVWQGTDLLRLWRRL
jgi:hypothetical protein